MQKSNMFWFREKRYSETLINICSLKVPYLGFNLLSDKASHKNCTVRNFIFKSNNQVIQTERCNKIRSEKKKQKGKNLTSLGINTPVYINDSLCIYYKKLWAKCKKLHNNKLIYAFWISNGSIKLKVSENGNIHVITHDLDLEELFPNNELIKDIQRV